MSETTVIQNDSATLWWDEPNGIVHHAFHRFIHGADFRQIMEAGAELMEKHKATKWLSDDRANGALPKADSEWAQGVWFPRVMRAGWKYWALVQPETLIGQMNMKRFTTDYAERGLTVRVFSELEPARAWLEAQ